MGRFIFGGNIATVMGWGGAGLEQPSVGQAPVWLARRPALPAAVGLIVGIILHGVLPAYPWVWIGLSAVVLIVAWRVRSETLGSLLLLTGLVGVGLAGAQVAAYRFPALEIGAFTTEEPRLAELELHLNNPPRLLTQIYGRGRNLPPKQVTVARVLAVRTWEGWEKATGHILVQIAEPHPAISQGQQVRVLGRLERPSPAMNPGQFDWARYYRDQRILASIQVPNASNIRILDQHPPSFVDRLRIKARRALAQGFPSHRSLDHALLRALLLGDFDPELRDVQDQFRRTGTSHHLVISGMHVGVLGGVVYLVCRLMRLRPRWSLVVGTGFIVLYACVTLPGTPVLRAVLMALFFSVAALRGRPVDAVQLLSLAAIVMLLLFPLDVLRPGFQLSFGTVLALCVFTQPLINRMTGRDDPDAWIEHRLRYQHWLMTAGQWLDRRMLQALAAALVAWIASVPLVARHFEQLNPYTVFFSILLGPLVFLSLLGGLLKVLLTLALPSLDTLWAWIMIQPTVWMRRTVEGFALLPGGDVPLPAPPWWLVGVFYASFGLLLINWPNPGLRWWVRLVPLGSCLAILALPFNGGFTRTPVAGELRVTVLAVGAGQCVVVEPPNGRVTLIDAGSMSLTDPLRRCLGPFLRHRGHTSVDRIVISHPDLDHFSAVADIAAAYGVREVLVSHHFHTGSLGNPPAEAMLRALDRLDLSPRKVAAGEVVPLGRDTAMEILWPYRQQAQVNSNDDSLVVRLSHAGRTILLPGDVQNSGKLALMESKAQHLPSDVLIAPHHGSAETTTASFLQVVNPSYIISSNARRLTMKQKRFDALVGSAKLFRTHRHGAVTIRISSQGIIDVQPFIHPRH